MKYLGLHILVFFSGFTLHAQRPLYTNYKRFDTENHLPQNNIAFAGPNGDLAFDPAAFRADTFPPLVNFTGISVNDKLLGFATEGAFPSMTSFRYKTSTDSGQTEKKAPPQKPLAFADSYSGFIYAICRKYFTKEYTLAQPLNELEKLELAHNQNTIDFYLAAMPYNLPGKSQFRYQLQGFDRDWVVLGAYNRIRFTRLPCGKYTLRVNASNPAGMWSASIKELKVIVHPPIWLAWWAYVLYGLMAGLLVKLP